MTQPLAALTTTLTARSVVISALLGYHPPELPVSALVRIGGSVRHRRRHRARRGGPDGDRRGPGVRRRGVPADRAADRAPGRPGRELFTTHQVLARELGTGHSDRTNPSQSRTRRIAQDHDATTHGRTARRSVDPPGEPRCRPTAGSARPVHLLHRSPRGRPTGVGRIPVGPGNLGRHSTSSARGAGHQHRTGGGIPADRRDPAPAARGPSAAARPAADAADWPGAEMRADYAEFSVAYAELLRDYSLGGTAANSTADPPRRR